MADNNYKDIASKFVDMYITSGAEAAALYVASVVEEEKRPDLYPHVKEAFDKRGYDLV